MVKVWYENPEGAAPAQGLYSHAGCIEGGRTVYLAGQLSVGPRGEVVGAGDFDAQFRQVFKNLHDVLTGLGLGWRSVIKFTTYLVHSQDIAKFMDWRKREFPKLFADGRYPPNTLLIIDRLVREEFLIEVSAVAAL